MKITLQRMFRAFTLVEILAVVAGIAILAGSGYVAISSVTRNAEESKLDADVRTINRAAEAYEASGGNFSGVSNVGELLEKLKSSAGEDASAATMGLRSSFLDKRVTDVAPSGRKGAIWNASLKRLEVVSATTDGSRGFAFDSDLATEDFGSEDRSRTKDVATESKWVWDFSDTGPPSSTPAQEPTSTAADPNPGGTFNPLIALTAPDFTPPGGSYPLSDFDPAKPVTITNPNPAGSSQIYYSLGGAYLRYTGPVAVPPDATLVAVAISQDPNVYTNSNNNSALYNAAPIQLTVEISAPAAVTYQQAGGAMTTGTAFTAPPITVTMTASVPASYDNKYQIRYTLDGSDPAQSGAIAPKTGATANIPYTYASFGAASALPIRAVAISADPNLLTSPIGSRQVSASKVTLAAPTISPTNGNAGDTATISLASGASYPTAFSLVINGPLPTSPTQTSSLSPTNIIGVAAGELTALVAAPTLANWFNPSPTTSATFETGSTGSTLPPGILVGSLNVSGSGAIFGSVTISAEHTGDMVMGGSTEIKGNLYLPSTGNLSIPGSSRVTGNVYVQGTPQVWTPYWPVVSWSPATDHNFSPFIKGNEYDLSGNPVSPPSPGWSASPRVIDLDGDPNPTNYKITFGGGAWIDGKVYRRAGPAPSLPTVAEPPPRDNNKSRTIRNNTSPITINPKASSNNETGLTISGSGQPVTLKAGNYGTVKVQNGREIILGDPDNPNVVQKYSFESLQVSGSSKVTIVGKVEITINYDKGGSFALANSTSLGNADHPEYVQLLVYSAAAANGSKQHVSITGSSHFYGQISAPKGKVTVEGSSTFHGSATAYQLDVSGSSTGTVRFDLPPITD